VAPEFFACADDREILHQLTKLYPENPFCTAEFFEARRQLGDSAMVIGQRERGRIVSACGAFLRTGRLNKSLEVVSVSKPPAAEVFWPALLEHCQSLGVTELFLNSFASERVALPAYPGEINRTARREFLLDLKGGDLTTGLSSNHVRNIKKAQKLGLRVRETNDTLQAAAHFALVDAALQRRERKGERVSRGVGSQYEAFLSIGAGTLFQAIEGEKVLASILVLRAPAGAYYQSSGSDPDARSKGAAHLLVLETSAMLQAKGIERFNLGGAHEPGLARFKEGFGARVVELEAASYYVGGRIRRQLTRLVRRGG
jgi:hypothetical protein